MAAAGVDDVDYESDPEEAKRSLTMRRREASDDEEERERGSPPRRIQSRDVIGSDAESEGKGAPEEYEDDDEESEEYHEFDEVEESEEVGSGVVQVANEGSRSVGDLGSGGDGEAHMEEEGGKKENEPFAVPTAGAFYMHDDRFRNNARGRNRRMLGGRKLWESQNDSKWGHDKFEELTTQEKHYNEGTRNFRGRYRGRGKYRGGDRGNLKGDKPKVYDTYNQNQVPKMAKGRGFKKYDSLKKNKNETPQMQYRPKSVKPVENTGHAASGRAPTASSDLERGPVSSTKQAFASSLNSASPPFYPSGSSSKETTTFHKRDAPAGNVHRNARSADGDAKFSPSQPNATRGRNGVDSLGMNRFHINDSVSSNAGKLSMGSSMVSSGHPRAQMAFRPVSPHNQIPRASMPHFHTVQRNSIQSGGQSSPQSSVHQSRQFPASGSQTSSPARAALTLNPFEHGESASPSESSKFKSALVAKEKSGVQGGGKGSFMYDGSQVMAVSSSISNGHGDQKFAGAPTFLPVMPFGGQHPGSMGVPAVGMAIPGYVTQPNGLGNSEMTWLPVLAGAAGALGSAYGSPYIALESAYHSRPSGQTSSSGASSKESDANKSNNEWKPSHAHEVTKDEVGQRQKHTRRYTEMKFGHQST